MIKKISLLLGNIILYTITLPMWLIIGIFMFYKEFVVESAFEKDDLNEQTAISTLRKTLDKMIVKHKKELVMVKNIYIKGSQNVVMVEIENEHGFRKKVLIDELDLEPPAINDLGF